LKIFPKFSKAHFLNFIDVPKSYKIKYLRNIGKNREEGCRKGVPFFALILRTPCLPFLTDLYNLFYINGIKGIPAEYIYDLLTPIALAHWIIGDGTWTDPGTLLCTNSFTFPDVVCLMNVLVIRYGLVCTLRKDRGRPCSVYALTTYHCDSLYVLFYVI
jgi:hypothetical protein